MQEIRDASNRLAYCFDSISPNSYRAITDDVTSSFRLDARTDRVVGLSEVFQEFCSADGQAVGLEWDNWSGYMVVSLEPSSEQLAKEVATFIQQKYGDGE